METNIITLIHQFAIEGTCLDFEPIKSGHINDTYLIRTIEPDKPDYILQKINNSIFLNVAELQDNIVRVTSHIRAKLALENSSNIDQRVIGLVPAKDGAWYCQSSPGSFWRVMKFIKDSHSYDQLSSQELAFKAGKAFGEFGSLLADLPGEPLYDTIKDFHNIEWRLKQFSDALKSNPVNRISMVGEEIKSIQERADEMCLVQKLGREGKLPKRIVHCDTKINNVLFDRNDNILCVIDLDTVMTGYVSSDFGDAIRTGTNNGAEDDPDLEKVSMNLELFQGFAEGYITGGASFLTTAEINILPFSAKLFAYMQAVRFLTDFINGDTYYKIHSPYHNLQRTKAQLKLLFSMEEQYPAMCEIVNKVAKEKCKNYA